MEDVKVVNSFCDVTYDFAIHFALLNVKCMLRYSHLDEACSIMLEYLLFKISKIDNKEIMYIILYSLIRQTCEVVESNFLFYFSNMT